MRTPKLLNQPFSKWEKAIDRMSTVGRMQLEDEAAALAMRAARLSAYISRRMSGGKHADAVKRQNETARKVRRALGFTYPDTPITF